MSSFGTAMLSSVVNLAAADFQNEIGDIFANGANGGEGSLGHMLLHSGLGCVTSSITGGNCAAGAAGGLIQSVYAGAIQDGEPTRDQYESDEAFNAAYGEWSSFHLNMVSMLGGIGGYVFSGGEAANVNIASSVAQSGLQNNYLNHTQRAEAEKLLEAIQACKSASRSECSLSDLAKMTEAYDELKLISIAQDQELFEACANGSSPECTSHVEQAQAYLEWSTNIDQSTLNAQVFADADYNTTVSLVRMYTADEYISSSVDGNMGVSQAKITDPITGERQSYSEWSQNTQNCATVNAECAGRFAETFAQQEVDAATQFLEISSMAFGGGAIFAGLRGLKAADQFDKISEGLGIAGCLLSGGFDCVDVSRVDTPNTTNNLDLDNPDVNGNGGGGNSPYDPNQTRVDLETTYGADSVTSTTVPSTSLRGEPGSSTLVIHGAEEVRVIFDQRGFPVFDDFTAYDTRVDFTDVSGNNYSRSMRAATRDLRDGINSGRIDTSQFTQEQLQAIQSGAPKIPDYTWHHHQEVGRMQLVPETIHSCVSHIGGNAMCQGR